MNFPFIQRHDLTNNLSKILLPLKEQYLNVDLFQQNIFKMLNLDTFYSDKAEQNEWVLVKKTQRNTKTAVR